MINIDMNQEVWYDNKVVKFIKESDECGGISIIEINGKKTHAYTKGIYTLEQISNMFTKETPLDSEIEGMFKTKYTGFDDKGKILLAYSSEQINTIRLALQPKSIGDEEIKGILEGLIEISTLRKNDIIGDMLGSFTKLKQHIINMQEENRGYLMQVTEYGYADMQKKDKLEKAREEVTNMMIEFDEMGFEVTTTTPNTIQEIKERYFAPINNILGDEKNE